MRWIIGSNSIAILDRVLKRRPACEQVVERAGQLWEPEVEVLLLQAARDDVAPKEGKLGVSTKQPRRSNSNHPGGGRQAKWHPDGAAQLPHEDLLRNRVWRQCDVHTLHGRLRKTALKEPGFMSVS